MRDLHNSIDVRVGMNPERGTDNTAVVSAIIDKANFGSLTWLIAIGTIADADATFVVLVEDGDDSALSDNAAVADAFLIGTEALAAFTFANDDEVRMISYIGPKRYCRLTITPADNTGNFDLAAVAVLGHARKGPQSSQT